MHAIYLPAIKFTLSLSIRPLSLSAYRLRVILSHTIFNVWTRNFLSRARSFALIFFSRVA